MITTREGEFVVGPRTTGRSPSRPSSNFDSSQPTLSRARLPPSRVPSTRPFHSRVIRVIKSGREYLFVAIYTRALSLDFTGEGFTRNFGRFVKKILIFE